MMKNGLVNVLNILSTEHREIGNLDVYKRQRLGLYRYQIKEYFVLFNFI